MKEIVIKIPDNMLDVIKNSENTTWLAVTYGSQLVWQVKNGTELPKGHGELITKGQAVALVQFYQQNPQHFSFENLIDDIDKEKPLIEADKGDTDGNKWK